MKKLKLSLQNIEGVDVFTREQLKMVMGGDGGSGGIGCKSDAYCGNGYKCCGCGHQGDTTCVKGSECPVHVEC